MSDEPRATRRPPPEAPCLNCGNTTPGAYCPACGQRKTWVRVSVRTMIADVLEDQLVLNRALPRTVSALLFRPGLLTEEYVRGRIVRYIAPFRLYLVASVIFFLIVSFVGLAALERVQIGSSDLSADADSTRAVLEQRLRALVATDTTDLPEVGRTAVRNATERTRSALAAVNDTATTLDIEELARLEALLQGDTTVAPGGRQPWARNIRMSSPWGWLNEAMQRKTEQIAHLPPREAVRALIRDLLEYAPHMVFVLLPVFALLLKLLYIRRRHFYAEHFVFALHVHAFVFVMMTLMFVLPWDAVNLPIMMWIMAYVWLAMKRVYAQGWLVTTAKWWTLGWLYFFVLLVGLAGLAVATLMLT
jgi:hypothetical protein